MGKRMPRRRRSSPLPRSSVLAEAAHEQRACHRKERYVTRKQARGAISKGRMFGDDCVAYKCVYCRGYHLTHRLSTPLASDSRFVIPWGRYGERPREAMNGSTKRYQDDDE